MGYKNLEHMFAKSTTMSLAHEKEALKVIDIARSELPDLRGLKVIWPEQGVFSHVAFIGDYVIKSPKENKCITSIKLTTAGFRQECEILKKLEQHPLVPNIIRLNKEFNFCVMQRMPGTPLKTTYGHRDWKQNKRIANTLAKFTHEMSEIIPAEQYSDNPLYDKDDASEILYKIKHTKRTLQKEKFKTILGHEKQTQCFQIIETLENICKNNKPIMFHNDFRGGNIIVNPKDFGEITGIIDFGRVGKTRLPELCPNTESLGINMNVLFSKAYYNHKSYKNDHDVVSILKAFNEINSEISLSTNLPKSDLNPRV